MGNEVPCLTSHHEMHTALRLETWKFDRQPSGLTTTVMGTLCEPWLTGVRLGCFMETSSVCPWMETHT